MHGTVLWSAVAGFLLGVFLRSLLPLSWPVVLFALLLSFVAAFAAVRAPRRARPIAAAVFLFTGALGILRMDAAAIPPDPMFAAQAGSAVTIEGLVVEAPDVRDRSVRLHVETGSSGILVVAPPHADIRYGDRVRATGRLDYPESFDTALGRTFDYPMYLAKDGISFTLSFAEIDVIERTGGNPLKRAAIATKQFFLSGLHAVLPEPQSGLAAGITLGEKRGVGEHLTEVFIVVGLVHIVVLSGYNITIVMSALALALTRLGRAAQLAGSACVVLFIVIMAGAAPSAVRAGAMAILPLIAKQTGRTYLALRALGAVAAAMVAWNPYLLVFDPGFQLSVFATFGLIAFSPLLYDRLGFITARFGVREIAASTVGTQLTVLPLLLYQNGLVSFVALPANLLALIAVPYAMAASAVAALAGAAFGSFGVLFALPAHLLLSYLITVGEFFAALPFASVTLPAFSAWLLVPIYGALLSIVWRVRRTP